MQVDIYSFSKSICNSSNETDDNAEEKLNIHETLTSPLDSMGNSKYSVTLRALPTIAYD